MFKKIFAAILASITMISSYAQAQTTAEQTQYNHGGQLIAKGKKNGHKGHLSQKCMSSCCGPSYLSVFTKFNAENSDAQSVIAPGAAILFDQTKTQSGSAMAPYAGAGVVTFNSCGTYEVTYGVSGFANSGSVIVGLQLDSTLVAGSELNTTVGTARMIGLSIILTVNAGQTLQLINTDTTNNLNLDAYPNGPPSPVTGYMCITQMK